MSPSFRSGILAVALTSLLSFPTGSLSAAEAQAATASPPPTRPKIGLVLAGGGARGVAHVGVIRMLEELNVPVDYVVGSSMGAIVAGLYAAGYDSAEMEAWLRECDWDQMLGDRAPRPQRGFRAKTEEMDTPRWLEFGLDSGGLKVPNAIVSGQNLLVALREKTDFVGTRESFDDLPVPYRAVATDIETGAMVVIDRGALADAMRASMALPAVFAPYTINGRVLIDGFASRNLPISVARDLGADVIIAVDVRPELLPADQLNNPVAMAQQLVAIFSQRDTLEQIATLTDKDVLVRLKLPGHSSSAYRDSLEILRNGYAEAEAARAALAPLSLPAAEYAAHENARRALTRDLPIIAAIEVEASNPTVQRTIRNRLSIRPGERLDPAQLSESLGRVHDLGYFESVDYRIDDRPEGRVLVVSTRPKPWGPNFAIFGIGLGSNLAGSSELNVRSALRFTQLNRFNGELALKTSLGTIDRIDAEFFQPVGRDGLFFVAPRAELLRTPEAFSFDLRSISPAFKPLPLTFDRQTLFGGIAGGIRIGAHGEVRVGAERGTVRYSNVKTSTFIVIGPDGTATVIDPSTVLTEYTTNRLTGALTFDRLDDAFFPRKGYYLHGRVERESAGSGTTTGGFLATAPFALGSVVLQPRLSANYTLESDKDFERLPYHLGGLFNLSGVPTDEVFGSNALVGSLILRKRLGGGDAVRGVFVGGSIELGNTWDESDRLAPESWIVAGSLFAATSTPFGPVHIGLGLAKGYDPTLYFYLGRVLP